MPDWTLRSPAPELERRYHAEGLWTDESLGRLLDRYLREDAGEVFRVWSGVRPYHGSMGEVHDLAMRVAGGLRARGVGPGDVVSFQLPNWMEAAAVFWGVGLLGAVLVPVVHFYGRKELDYILRVSGSRVHITAGQFGHLDYPTMLAELLDDLPVLEHVFVVGDGARGVSFEPFERLVEGDGVDGPAAVDPADPALVAFTSGTTSDPKGVIHTHRSVAAETRSLGDLQGSGDNPMIVGAPVGHAIGMLSGLLLPLYRGHPVHLVDVWDPATVLAAMAEEELNGGSGSTFFLQSLLDHPDCGPEHHALMEKVGLGGSPVPAAIAERAASLGISIVRSFGCTEHPSITGSRHEEPAPKRMYTDGHAMTGVELRIVGESGDDVEPGASGEIWSRGPDLFAGYTDPTLTSAAFTDDGWFRTGDIGTLDSDGYLTITDRLSDVIIRGGENISAAEVEGALMRMTGVAEVAVVAAPDARLGEHACAFVRPSPDGRVPELDAVRRYFEDAGLARQKWPEEIRAIDEFPRTPSGKIKKYVLREQLLGESTPNAGTPTSTGGDGDAVDRNRGAGAPHAR